MEILPTNLLAHGSTQVREPFAESDKENARVAGPALTLMGGWWDISLWWTNRRWDEAQEIVSFLSRQGKRTFGLPLGGLHGVCQKPGANLGAWRQAAGAGRPLARVIAHSRKDGTSDFVWQAGAVKTAAELREQAARLLGCYVEIDGRIYRAEIPAAYLGALPGAVNSYLFRTSFRPLLHLDSFSGGNYAMEILNPVAGVKIKGDAPVLPYERFTVVDNIAVDLREVRAE